MSYLASDGLGTADVAVRASDSSTTSVLYSPYGGVRYSAGAMPTDYGFTGQHADSATGLDYYNARYYDPLAWQFTSADTVLPGGGYDILGLSRYAYVEGNPEVRTDPSGLRPPPECEGRCDKPAETQSTTTPTNNGACGGSGSLGPRCQEAVSLSPAERIQIMYSFFDAYPGSSTEDQIGGLGEGILAFTEWEISSGRLDPTSGSLYWKATNGLIALDMRDAHNLLNNGQTVSNNPGVQGWIDYANTSRLHISTEQKQRLLWKAHQTSLHQGTRLALNYLVREAYAHPYEGSVISDVLKNVDVVAIGNLSTADTGAAFLNLATSLTYPAQYPAALSDATTVNLATRYFTLGYENIGVESTRW
ncbi:MAG: RHS repeat-associated core domain-containing protein [Candidatus Dormibacteraeota bacterium]|nr:RHS repeat-associated core domain-containing protein [Candidatus Dormibacteraeota bacterium]